jgi:hypothetical protein
MYKYIFLFCVSLMSWKLSICQDNGFIPSKPEFSTILDSSKGKQLLSQCSRRTPQNISGFFQLNNSDIAILEESFNKAEKDTKHAFQYMGVIIGGKRYIYINAFGPDSKGKWKTEPVVVCDGGSSFWGILFDIEKKKFSQFSSNGVA